MGEIQATRPAPPAIPELLAPAGSFDKLVTAIHYGADAVYLSGRKYGLRARAANFDEAGIEKAVSYARRRGVKVYATVNIFAHNRDFDGLDDYLRGLAAAGVDAIIVADPGIVDLARAVAPALPIHLSTQANVTNSRAARFWQDRGITRINLARELSLAEIKTIRAGVDADLEVFVHGALCISYSGRCLLSSYLTGRDANRGNCAHPCRYRYALVEEKRPGEYFPVVEDGRGTYIFNSKDLCLLPRLPELVAAGVDAVKIEGRMKSVFYVGGVVRAYRAALDQLAAIESAAWRTPEQIVIDRRIVDEIDATGTRGAGDHFVDGQPGPDDMLYAVSRLDQVYEPVALVKEAAGGSGPFTVELRSGVRVGEEIEFMHRSVDTSACRVAALRDVDGAGLERGHPGDTVELVLTGAVAGVAPGALFRRRKRAAPGTA